MTHDDNLDFKPGDILIGVLEGSNVVVGGRYVVAERQTVHSPSCISTTPHTNAMRSRFRYHPDHIVLKILIKYGA